MLKRRIAYYSIGLILGIIAVKCLQDKKGYKGHYLPSSRILYQISQKSVEIEPSAAASFSKAGISEEYLKKQLQNEEIWDVELTDREAEPCKEFMLSGELFQKEHQFHFFNCDSTLLFHSIVLP